MEKRLLISVCRSAGESSSLSERASITSEPYPIGEYLKYVLKHCNSSTNQYNAYQAKILTPTHLLKLQMTIPGESHEGVGEDE